MKNKKDYIFITLVLLFSISAACQVPQGIYGITDPQTGGIFRFDPITGTNTFLPNAPTDFRGIAGGCAPGIDAKFYGISSFGGSLNLGVIYSFDPITGIQSPLITLTGPNGANGTYWAANNLILASDNYFYGMTYFGGKNNAGTIFRFDPVNLTDTVLYSFDTYLNTPFWGYPSNGFTLASDGKFYGMTLGGGENGKGYVFQFDPVTAHFQPVFSFDGTNGRQPSNRFVQGENGKLYGIAGGGKNDYGLIFSLDLSTLHDSVLYNMDYKSGATNGSLLYAKDGNLYGLSWYGGLWLNGCFYRYNPATNVMTILHTYDGETYGEYGTSPVSQIVQADNGNLYYCLSSLTYSHGIIVSYNPATMKDTIASVLTDATGGGMLLFQIQGSSNGVGDQSTTTYGLTVYPNPFTSTTTIKYKVTEPDFVLLKVYDVMGTEVASLVNEKKAVGEFTIELNATGLSDGIYFCRLQAGLISETKKLVLHK